MKYPKIQFKDITEDGIYLTDLKKAVEGFRWVPVVVLIEKEPFHKSVLIPGIDGMMAVQIPDTDVLYGPVPVPTIEGENGQDVDS